MEKIAALDEGDIALLKSYVSGPRQRERSYILSMLNDVGTRTVRLGS